jgi:hypothetical protein
LFVGKFRCHAVIIPLELKNDRLVELAATLACSPKGTDFTATSHREVAAFQSSLNDRPRKRLGYRTPREVL